MILSISHASKYFGSTTVFEDIQFEIKGNEKIALIGKNGCGKTTLLKVIADEITLDKGSIHKRNGVKIGYLAQMTFQDEKRSVEDELFAVFHDLREMNRQLEQVSRQMETDHSEALLEKYADLQHAFEEAGGYTYESEAKTVVSKFGFSAEDMGRPLHTFSGGQKTKLAFAKLLLSKPDVLLLDEPTNHLDLQTIEWLEGYLKKYAKAIVVVSHDRYFLDEVVDMVCELSLGSLSKYRGNYTSYLAMRSKDIEKNAQAYQRQQKDIARLEALIEKFRYKRSKAAFAQSKIKYLERMDKIEPIEIDERKMKVRFTPKTKGGKTVLELDQLQVGYEQVLCEVSMEIIKGQRIAILGPNGEGKSTFLKTIMGLVPALGGEFLFGHQIEVGYFDQQMAQLNSAKTVLEELWDEHPEITHTQIRTVLGCFLFTDEEVFKQVNQLSGGEKVRLSLAKLMLERGNFLILDEPTNHLDIDSKEILEEALQEFDGTLLFVSHDRYFIKRMANSLLEIKHGKATYIPTTYDEYMGKVVVAQQEKKAEVKEVQVKRVLPEREVKKLEKMIEEKEGQLGELREKRFDETYYHDYRKMQELDSAIDTLHNEINELLTKWEELQS